MEELQMGLEVLAIMEPGLQDNGVYQEIMEKLGENMDTTDQKKEDFARLVAGANEVRDGLAVGSRFQVGLTDLDAGLNQLVDGQAELVEGTETLAGGAEDRKSTRLNSSH